MPQQTFHKGTEFQALGCEVHSNCATVSYYKPYAFPAH